MPIYEYEPIDRECLMCDGRIEVIQSVDDEPFKYCPHCGLGVCRVVSRASIKLKGDLDPETAAKKGFSTFKRIGKSTYEKVAGPEGDGPKPKKEGVIRPSDLEDSD